MCRGISVFGFCIWLQKSPFESFFDIWKSGHFRSRSFSVIFKNDLVIWVYSIYKYYLYNTIGEICAPRKRKWPKMTVTENDRIGLLKVIQKEIVGDCNMMIISKLAYAVVSACTMFCIVGTAHIPLLSTPVFLLFLRESWQNISRNSSFYPFHPTFSLSYICLLRRWKVPSEPLFLALKSIFLLPFHRKTNPAFLVIFAWVMWFSVNNGIWLFRG